MPESSNADSSAQVRLETLVRQTIEEQGQLLEGKTWAIRPRQDWAEMAGVSAKTVTRVFQKAPFDTLRKRVEGRQAALVRIGKPDPNQPSRLAATMAKIFLDNIVQNDAVNAKQKAICEAAGREWKPKKDVTPKEYGCLIGLAQDFRQDWQLDIFKYAISADGWKRTKDLSKYKTEDLETPMCGILEENKGASFIKLKPGKAHLFHHYPNIRTLRVFWMCAESAFVASHMKTNLSEVPKEEVDFWEEWWAERDTAALHDWEPDYSSEIDPIKDVSG